jgi:hypothetical protein
MLTRRPLADIVAERPLLVPPDGRPIAELDRTEPAANHSCCARFWRKAVEAD